MERCYEMYTKSGDKACDGLVKRIIKKISGTKRVTPQEIEDMVDKGMEKIAIKYSEVYDTEPYYHIRNYVDKAMVENNYQKVFNKW